MFLNGALGARKKSKVKGKSAKLKRMIDNFEKAIIELCKIND